MTCKSTVLLERHQAAGGKMVEFCGWTMPIQYTGVIQEHMAVREAVGIFDVSHMGRVEVTGKDAEALLDYVSANKIQGKKDQTATYTVWPNEQGGSVDDCIVYRWNSERFFVVVNAGNRAKDLAHLKEAAKNFDVTITDRYEEDGILAVQGPKALELSTELFPEITSLKFMRFASFSFCDQDIIIARTGYTGESGIEIYAPNDLIGPLWDLFLDKGKKYGIEPIGLGARDTLRLEKGFALYGHELSDEISPIESVSSWTVKLDKGEFIGQVAMKKLLADESKAPRSQIGLLMEDAGVAREGMDVLLDGEKIGVVTSGTRSPSLKKSIAIALVSGSFKEGDSVSIQVRSRVLKAVVTKIPFLT